MASELKTIDTEFAHLMERLRPLFEDTNVVTITDLDLIKAIRKQIRPWVGDVETDDPVRIISSFGKILIAKKDWDGE